MILRVSTILLLLGTMPVIAFSQLSGKGKIITIQGDTIECLIQIDKDPFFDIVKYKKSKEDRLQRFPLSELHRIVMKDKIYENVSFTRRNIVGHKVVHNRLCLCVVDGFVKLYKEGVTMFYDGVDGMVNTHLKPSEREVFYVAKGKDKAQEIRSKLFVKQLQKTFAEYKSVVLAIRNKKYNYYDLVKIVEDCNECNQNWQIETF